MVLALRPLHAYSHRFVGLNNTSIFRLVLSNFATSFPVLIQLKFYKALLLTSEFPTFYERLS